MNTLLKRLLASCLLVVGMAASALGQVVDQVGSYDDGNAVYKLYHSYYSNGMGGYWMEEYYATIYRFYAPNNTFKTKTIPAYIEFNNQQYNVVGIGANADVDTDELDIMSLTFEGSVSKWDTPVKFKGGIVGFNTLRFNERSYPFEGNWEQYFVNAPYTINVYVSDKNESQIAELLQTSPWNSFYSVNYTPIPLTLTTNITFSQSNQYEDVAVYSLDNYDSFEDANYDLSNLTLLNYSSPHQYNINKYQSYVLVARYNKENVDCQFKYNGTEMTMYSFNDMDYFSIIDAQSDVTIDLTFTWKTNTMNFIQVNESPDFSYSIGGNNTPMSGTISGPLGTVSGASSGETLTLTLPATHVLDKVVMLAGDTEQTIAAPEPSNGNYKVSFTVPTEKIAYVYVYWKEEEPNATFKFLRYGGGDSDTWIRWDDGVYEFFFNEGTSETTIPKEQLTTDMYMYLELKPGETFKVYKDDIDITSQFQSVNPTEYEMELDKKSATYTIIYEEVGGIIDFADPAVKAICVDNWDTNEDGEISMTEAAAVTNEALGETFRGNTEITSFDELQYFTGLTRIPLNAFYGDSALKSVVIPKSVTAIEAWSFRDCAALEHVVLPDSLLYINSGTFMNTSLRHITLPEKGTLMLGYYVFSGTPLKTLFIPANLQGTIYREVVSKCHDLISIAVDEGNLYYDSREGCNAIIKTATNTLIASCKNTVIPESVKALGDNAFVHNYGIKKLELPAGLESMGAYSLFRCDSLTSIVAHMQEPFEITTANIQGLPNNCILTVPRGKRQTYIDAGWTTDIFKGGIIEEETTNVGDVNGDGSVNISDVTALIDYLLSGTWN